MYNTYRDRVCTYVDVNWAWHTWLWYICDLLESHTNVFKSFTDLFIIFIFAYSLTSLLKVCNLVLDNIAQVPQYTVSTMMWSIHILPCWTVCEAFCREGKDNMRWRLNIVRLPCGHKFSFSEYSLFFLFPFLFHYWDNAWW